MKFTLRSNADPATILDIGTDKNEISAIDVADAAIKALEILGLRIERADCFQFDHVAIEVLPSGFLDEENAAKYLGYSVERLRFFREKSKTMPHNNNVLIRKKCPRYYKKKGRVQYKKSDLDDWLNSAASDKVPTPSLQKFLDRQKERLRGYRDRKREEKKRLADEATE